MSGTTATAATIDWKPADSTRCAQKVMSSTAIGRDDFVEISPTCVSSLYDEWVQSLGNNVAAGASWANSLEYLVAELSELSDGWAGADSVAPPVEVLNKILRSSSALQGVTRPEVEVDASDGEVTFVWRVGDKSSIAMTYTSGHDVVLIQSSLDTPSASSLSRVSLVSNQDVLNLRRKMTTSELSSVLFDNAQLP